MTIFSESLRGIVEDFRKKKEEEIIVGSDLY